MINKDTKQKRAIFIIFFHLFLYYAWLIYFSENEDLLKIGGNAFQLAAPIISAFWLFRASVSKQGKDRLFWLLFGIGNVFYLLAQLIWNYYEWILHIDAPAVGIADIIWCFQYIAYFIGMLLKMSQFSTQGKTLKLLMDILIVMVVSTTLSWEFIISPMLTTYTSNEWWEIFIYIFYPVGDLGLLFGALTIRYAAEKTSFKTLSGLLSLGIIFQIIADSYYSYAAPLGEYQTGNLIDPLWALSLFLIGIAVLYEEQLDYKQLPKFEVEKIKVQSSKKTVSDYFYFILPYVAVVFLFSLMLTRVRLDVIFIGVCLSVGLLVIRQILTLIENEDLLQKYKTLTNELDKKVKERTKELEHLAYHDQLTGLANRRYFEAYLKDTIDIAKNHHQQLAVLLLDLDRFKQINDIMGHSMGDYLLMKMAERLTLEVNNKAKVFRLGGDEFTVILPDTEAGEVEEQAQRINKGVSRPLLLGEEEITISASIGISMFPINGENADTLLKQADVAMYEAKNNGKNNYQFYTNEMKNRMSKQIMIENGLRAAIEDHSFSLAFQPIVNTKTEELLGAEALLRWIHPTLGNIPPMEFIPIAEETGLIVEMGYWIVETACFEVKKWHREGHFLYISINISVTQFNQSDFVEKIKSIIDSVGLDPKFIHFEITESVAILDGEMVVSRLKELSTLGIRISIDDFGTGYSSLNYLNKFPLSILKIDKSFIDGIDSSSQNKQIVSTIITLASTLKVNVIAEGVETEKQVRILKSLGCYYAQGYLISKPLNTEEFVFFISNSNFSARSIPEFI